MSHLWMPLCPSDYRSKTTRLSTAQHGAYLLLTMEYWEHESLPNDDVQLARITCQPVKDWLKMKPIIQSYFYDGWKHKRIDDELAKANQLSSKRRASAEKMHREKDAKAGASAHSTEMQKQVQVHTHSHSPNKINNIIGRMKKNGGYKRLPEHGDQTSDGKMRFMKPGLEDYAPFEQDYLDVKGQKPKLNQHGGFWFWLMGEAARPSNYRTIKTSSPPHRMEAAE